MTAFCKWVTIISGLFFGLHLLSVMQEGKNLPENSSVNSRQTYLSTQTHTAAPSFTYPSYCPKATCQNTDLCHPCQRRFLIMSQGRAASTTLRYMLGSLPGIRMGGENSNALGRLLDLYHNVLEDPHFAGAPGRRDYGAWAHHPIPLQTPACAAQNMIQALNPPLLQSDQKTLQLSPEEEASEIIAFKTIRYFDDIDTSSHFSLKKRVKFITENFPCARIVVNINSDITHLANTYIKLDFDSEKDIRQLEAKLRQEVEVMKNFVTALGPHRAVLLDKVQWTQNITKLNDVVSWLGFHESCHFHELLELNTEEHGFKHGKTEFSSIHPNCVKI